MRVAIVTETFLPKVDGIVTRLRNSVDQLCRLGDEVLVVCPEGGLREYKGAAVHGVPGLALPLYPEIKACFPGPSVGRALKGFKPDLIHVVNPVLLGLGGIAYARIRGIPLVASYHTHLPLYLRRYGLGVLEGPAWSFLRAAHNQARMNLVTSTAMRDELADRGIRALELWRRGVDTETYHPGLASREMRERLGQRDPASPLLLYVGRLSVEKDIERIKPILAALPGACLALVGDGPHRPALEGHFAGTATCFVGYLGGRELAEAYASADVFVFPSRSETLGLVLLEAMASGCPVVAARAGGIPDLVEEGVGGYLFDPEDEGGAVAAVRRLLADREAHASLRLKARKEAEKWDWASATRQLRGLYQSAIENPSLPR
jgi:glycosyltransferase involved in cell wall biosynthesis